jgi:hypothetical protein
MASSIRLKPPWRTRDIAALLLSRIVPMIGHIAAIREDRAGDRA